MQMLLFKKCVNLHLFFSFFSLYTHSASQPTLLFSLTPLLLSSGEIPLPPDFGRPISFSKDHLILKSGLFF